MLKSGKKLNKHEDLSKISKKDKSSRKNKLTRIREKESFEDLLTDDTVDTED